MLIAHQDELEARSAPRTAGPGLVGNRSLAQSSAPSLNDSPSARQIAGRVAHTHAASVDHGAQAAVGREEVAGQQVAVEPDRGAIPLYRADARTHLGRVVASASAISRAADCRTTAPVVFLGSSKDRL